ncbi:MAG TPA: hypothetical protein VGW75_05615 [Solirubrobacteraceae bacterium]|nr:hypothetical protein [Solirubrobacteraceae bacterium]
MPDRASPALCPSARCEPGALLVGVVNPDGAVGYVRPAPEVDEAFVERARARGRPETAFRFAQPCAESGCGYWDGGCRVASMAVEAFADADPDHLPRCGIRPACRWFRQEGAAACRACALVVTDVV